MFHLSPQDSDFDNQLFLDILNGYSCLKWQDGSALFKHPSHLEIAEIKCRYNVITKEISDTGIPDEKSKLEYVIDQGWWSNEQETALNESKRYLETLFQTREKAMFPSQKEQIGNTIKEEEKKLSDLWMERQSVLGETAEKIAEQQIGEVYLEHFLFKDPSLKLSLFSDDELDALGDVQVHLISQAINKDFVRFTPKPMKKTALDYSVQNLFYISDENVATVWGKPTVQLTKYQSELSFYAKIFRNIIKNSQDIPEHVLKDPDALLNWGQSSDKAKKLMERDPNTKNKRGQRSGRMTSFVGAKSSDLKETGVSSAKSPSLIQKAREAGGKLGMRDVIKNTQ